MTKHENPRQDRHEIDEQINKSLKRAFEEVASEPIPDRFTDLLQQLRQADVARPDTGKGDTDD